jgi:hypothetical protein
LNINKKCRLFLTDIRSYDISSCHYQIIKRLGFDVSKIPIDDKLERNKQIGIMMKENNRLINILRSITESTISEYLLENNIKENDIIIRQYDGFLTPKKVSRKNLHLPLDERPTIQHMIISIDRRKYISIDINNKVSIKGVPFKYNKINNIFAKLIRTNFAIKSQIFSNLQKIKEEILYSNDSGLYCIPTTEGKSNVFLRGYGETQISNNIIKMLDTKDIDKQKYFDFYILQVYL